ncbi:probable basic-leucine zipper transcription factor K isoform X2 [Drosophila nasuta]|uniref:probable basic-leucine zipper transcription factor K isoform X2 n=1 Tax=Drosophila nasuta TaxID=42062 RepID=UPI00295EF4C4|nr:probable basic-leucine zipper transcription factor K isoform X2 [Drosophila nasuta]
MDYLSENRYQLLFIDDDELMTDGNDAVEPVAGQQQQPQQQQQSKNKRNKNKNVNKPILEEKQSQQQQQAPRAAPEKKLPQQQPQQQQQPKQPQQQPQEQPKQQPQQQAQQQLDQQPKEQPKQQSQQQQPEQQQPQQQQPQFRYRQRIINNSNRYAGAGAGVGAGFGVGAAAYRGNSTRYAKTNNNTNNNNNNNLETDEGDGNNTQVVDDRKFITVEQWKAMRGERVKPIYNIRKPGEGELNKKPDWKHMTVLQKNKDNNNKSKLSEGIQKGSEEDNGLDYDASMYPQRVGRLQRIVDIEFKFKDDRRRSGAYRSGWMVSRPLNDNAVQQRTANETQPSLTQVAINNNDFETASDQINMNDEAEFPTLG